MEFAHVKSGNVSRGHRFLCKEPVVISDPLSYKETMREAFVIVDQDERRKMIRTGLLAVADKLGGHVWLVVFILVFHVEHGCAVFACQ